MLIRLCWYLLPVLLWVSESSIAEARTVIYTFEPIPQFQYKECFPRPIAVLLDGTVLFWGPACDTTMIYKWGQKGLEIFYDGSAAFSSMNLTLQEHGWIYFKATTKTPWPAEKLLRFSEDDAFGKPVDLFLGTNIKGGSLLPGASEHGGVVRESDGSLHLLRDGAVTDIPTSVPPGGLDYQNFVWTEAGSPSGRIARVVMKLNAPRPYPPVWVKIYTVAVGGPDSLEKLRKDPDNANRYQAIAGYTNAPAGIRAPTFQDEELLWSGARYTPPTPNSVVTQNFEIVRESPEGAKELVYTSGFKGRSDTSGGFDTSGLPHIIVGKNYMMMCTVDPPTDPKLTPGPCNRVTLIDGSLRYEVAHTGTIFVGTGEAKSFVLYSGVNALGAVILMVNQGFFVARPHWIEGAQ